jgi:hypothetical protein
MSITALLLAAAQALTVPANVRWEPVAADGGGRYEIDPRGLARTGDRVRFLMRAFPATAQADGSAYGIIRYVVDCRQRTRALEAVDFYRADGSLLSTRGYDSGAVPYEAIVPGSGDWQVMRRVCPRSPAH